MMSKCSISFLTLFRHHQNSHLRNALQTNFRSHTVVRDTCDIHVELHSARHPCCLHSVTFYLFSVITQFPISEVRCRQISDLTKISVIFIWCCIHPWHPWCHVQFPPYPSPLLSTFRLHTSSVTSVMSMINFIQTHLRHDQISHLCRRRRIMTWTSNLPSPQCVAELWYMNTKSPISAVRRRIMTWTWNFHIKSFRSPQCVAGSHSIVSSLIVNGIV